MTPEQIAELERRREEREDELLLILLLLIGSGSRQDDPAAAVRRILLLDGTREIAESMADAHLDAALLSGAVVASREELIRQYTPAAQESATAMADSIQKATAESEGNLLAGLVLAGFTRASTTGLELGIERNIVSAFNAGLLAAAVAIGGVTGLRHVSVLDERTTDICDERDGIQLPLPDPYWLTNWPSLHWRCRSILQPLFGAFTVTTGRPVTQPMAGFGRAPLAVLRILRGASRAA